MAEVINDFSQNGAVDLKRVRWGEGENITLNSSFVNPNKAGSKL